MDRKKKKDRNEKWDLRALIRADDDAVTLREGDVQSHAGTLTPTPTCRWARTPTRAKRATG